MFTRPQLLAGWPTRLVHLFQQATTCRAGAGGDFGRLQAQANYRRVKVSRAAIADTLPFELAIFS
jgi:hypothetical protein